MRWASIHKAPTANDDTGPQHHRSATQRLSSMDGNANATLTIVESLFEGNEGWVAVFGPM